MSPYLISTLRHISENKVTIDYLRSMHGGAIACLANRGYIHRVGNGFGLRIETTQAGEAVILHYDRHDPRRRKEEAALTERCVQLLHISQKLAVMRGGKNNAHPQRKAPGEAQSARGTAVA